MKNSLFSYKDDPGFWSSYSITLKNMEISELESILRKQLEPFLREIERDYLDFIQRNELNENDNTQGIKDLKSILEGLSDTYIGHSCYALVGIITMWQDFKTGNKKLYEQWKKIVEESIRCAICAIDEGLFCVIITGTYDSILDELISSIEKKYHEYNAKIKSCIDSIANIN